MTSVKTESGAKEWAEQVKRIIDALHENLDVTDRHLWECLDSIAGSALEYNIPFYFAGAFVMNLLKERDNIDLMNQIISYPGTDTEDFKISLILSYHAAISAEHIIDNKLADFLPSIVFPAQLIEFITLSDSLETLDYLIAYIKGCLDEQIGYDSVFIEQEYLSYMYSIFGMKAPTILSPNEWNACLKQFRERREGKEQGEKRHEFRVSLLNGYVENYRQITSVDKANLIRQLLREDGDSMQTLFDVNDLPQLDDPEPDLEDDPDFY